MNTRTASVIFLLGLAVFSGCRTSNYAERGALSGALLGGVTGAVLDDSADGAVAGGAIGTMVGAIVGDSIDADLEQRQAIAAQQAANERAPRPVTIPEIATMVHSGVGEQVIVNHIHTHGVAQPLTSNDIIQLHQQRIAEEIISAMQQAEVRTVPVSRVPPPAPVVIHEYGPPPYWVAPRHRHVYPRPGWRFYWHSD